MEVIGLSPRNYPQKSQPARIIFSQILHLAWTNRFPDFGCMLISMGDHVVEIITVGGMVSLVA